MITMFLLNEASLKLIELKQSSFDFRYSFAGDRVNDKENPCDAVAYDEKYTKEQYKKNNLEILAPIYYGSWCGRKETLCYQDYIFSVKKIS